MFSSSAEPPLWVMSTYFPCGENLRGMISAGNGSAGLISVFLCTLIRAIVYATVSGGTDMHATKISVWIFMAMFWCFLCISFAIAWFVPKLTTYKHFEEKAMKLQMKDEEEDEVCGFNGVLMEQE